jgi:hypothetical protein
VRKDGLARPDVQIQLFDRFFPHSVPA